MAKEENEVNRLNLKLIKSVIDFLMHIHGFILIHNLLYRIYHARRRAKTFSFAKKKCIASL